MSEKLLERGIMILPDVIEHEAYEAAAELLLTREEPVTLYCAGAGGSIRDGLAMVDLIQAHGQVTGMLAGMACSCHSVVWAACAERVVYPNGMLGIHKTGYSEFNRPLDSHSAWLVKVEMEHNERLMCGVYANASRQSVDWWHELMQKAGSGEYTVLTASQLFGIGMGRPAAQRGFVTGPPRYIELEDQIKTLRGLGYKVTENGAGWDVEGPSMARIGQTVFIAHVADEASGWARAWQDYAKVDEPRTVDEVALDEMVRLRQGQS